MIEIVDTEAKIEGFLPELEKMMGSGLVTLEKVQVLQYGSQVWQNAVVSRDATY